MAKPLCVVVGIGPKNGAAFARKFSREGYRLALVSRSRELSKGLANELGDTAVYECDVADAVAVTETFRAIKNDLGETETLIYNAGAGAWKTVDELSAGEFEAAFSVNALGLLLSAQQVLSGMRRARRGNIIVIGATASLRGKPKTTAFAAGKAAQRSLAQSMARHCAPQGVHVALLIIDGAIGNPGLPADDPGVKSLRPEDIADEVFHLTRQARSAWTFELDLRPQNEPW